ncbi:MAG: hypothetical protein KTR31_26550 [Myxococcales bacterium]|nr:hypothetical protein [Myxococcales bacterium]
MTRIIPPLVLALGCSGPDTTTPSVPAPTTDPGTDVTTPVTEPTTPVTGPVSLTLLDYGDPVVDALVAVHDHTGAVLTVTRTDAYGRVVVDDVTEDGIGFTLADGLSPWIPGPDSFLGLKPGTDLVLGHAELPASIHVEYTLPDLFPEGADMFVVKAGCSSSNVYQAGRTATMSVETDCLPGETVQATALALVSWEPVAYVHLTDLPPMYGGEVQTYEADFAEATWSTDFAEAVIEHVNVPYEASGLMELWAPSQQLTLGHDLQGQLIEPEGSATLVVPLPPNVGDSVQSSFMAAWADNGEQWHVRSVRRDPFDQGALVTTDLTEEIPGRIGGVHALPDLSVMALSEHGEFRCGEDRTIDASSYALRGYLNGRTHMWRVLAPGQTDGTFELPELPEDFASAWPVDELEDYLLHVQQVGHTAQDYADLLAQPDPFAAIQAPEVEVGERACHAYVHASFDQGPSCTTSCI